MEEDNVDGRKAAQACERIQPGWLADIHFLLDVSKGTARSRELLAF